LTPVTPYIGLSQFQVVKVLLRWDFGFEFILRHRINHYGLLHGPIGDLPRWRDERRLPRSGCRSSYDATTTASYVRLGLPHTLGIQNHLANAGKPDSPNKRPQKAFFELCKCTRMLSYPNTTYCSHWSQPDTPNGLYRRSV